jgi:hypothetical protein
VLATAVCIKHLPSTESLDEVATMETFTNVMFPNLLLGGGVSSLACLRLAIAFSIWFTIIELAVVSKGWTQHTFYLAGSKLKQTPTRMKGIRTLGPFTCWSWILLGISFTLNGYISILGATTPLQSPVSPWLLRIALCIWAIAAPCTLLVSAVVRYAIWPMVLAAPDGDTSNLKNHRNMMMHNMNSIYAVSELALTGGLPIRLNEMCLLPLYGIVYVIFTWSMTKSWHAADPSVGPQFIYFFFDTTLPGVVPTIALAALLAVLLVGFGIFYACEYILASIGGGSVLAHIAFCVVVCGSVMRFRD